MELAFADILAIVGGVILFALPLLPLTVPQSTSAIELRVDASQAARNLIRVVESVPVKAGRMSLSYPKWIPGEHQPSGPIDHVIRLFVKARGKELPWTRTTADINTISFDVPTSTPRVDVEFVIAEPAGETFSSQLGRLKWNRFVFLPAGPIAKIPVHAYLTPPEGWSVQTALPAIRTGATVEFDTVMADRLVDSPAQLGRNARTFDLGDRHFLDVLTERPEQLDLKPELVDKFRKLVKEALAVTGARHYRQYRFLMTFSEFAAGEGLEHHESSEDGVGAEDLDGSEKSVDDIGELVAHEMFHSWNGKHRRPAGLATEDFSETQNTELLWVYEGLTQYYGLVLACRAGFVSPETMREVFANVANDMAGRHGRSWRSVADTATGVASTRNAGTAWQSDRRRTDYYSESALVWLEVDSIIRTRTQGQKSLDTFVREFHGGQDSGPVVLPYTFDDVVAGLNRVVAYDWRSLLRTRIYTPQPNPPIAGIQASGWDVTYNDKPNVEDGWRTPEAVRLINSVGVQIKADGMVEDVALDSAADRAGVTVGMKVLTVGDRPFSVDVVRDAVAAKKPFTLSVVKDGLVSSLSVDYVLGIRRPHLTRLPMGDDLLSLILEARSKHVSP